MLGAAETNAFSSESHGTVCIAGIVGIGPYAKPAVLIGPREQFPQIDFLVKIRVYSLDDAGKHLAGGTIDRDVVSLAQHEIRANNVEKMLFFVDANAFTSRDAGKAEPACHYRRVAGRATTSRQDTLGYQHTMDIIGAGLWPDQDDRCSRFTQFFGAVRVETGLAAGGSRRSIQALGQETSLLLGLLFLIFIKARQQ